MTIQSRVTRSLVQFVNEMEDQNDRSERGNQIPLLPRHLLDVPLSESLSPRVRQTCDYNVLLPQCRPRHGGGGGGEVSILVPPMPLHCFVVLSGSNLEIAFVDTR